MGCPARASVHIGELSRPARALDRPRAVRRPRRRDARRAAGTDTAMHGRPSAGCVRLAPAACPGRRSEAAPVAPRSQGYHPNMGTRARTAGELEVEDEAWHRFHAVMYRITPDIAEVPGYFAEGWTAKDAVAHIGTWMAQGAQMLRRIAAGTYQEGEIDVDAENARFLAAMRDVPLDTVHLQAASARAELRRAWAELPEVTPAA